MPEVPTTPSPEMATKPPMNSAIISGVLVCRAWRPGWPSSVLARSLVAAASCSRNDSRPNCVMRIAISARARAHVPAAVSAPAEMTAPMLAAMRAGRVAGTNCWAVCRAAACHGSKHLHLRHQFVGKCRRRGEVRKGVEHHHQLPGLAHFGVARRALPDVGPEGRYAEAFFSVEKELDFVWS